MNAQERRERFNANWAAICPDGVITMFSCIVPPPGDPYGPAISDSGFPDHLREFIRENKVFADMHREHQSGVWKNKGGTCSRIEKNFGGYACLLYYEMGPGMVRGSYDGLWLSLAKLSDLHQSYPWNKSDDPIKVRVPYSVRSGMDRDVFDVIVRKTLPAPRYIILP